MPSICRAEIPAIRIIWTISLIASIAACCYLTILSFLNYNRYEFRTQIELMDVSDTGLVFPLVEVSSMRTFASPAAQDYLLKKMRERYGSDVNNISDILIGKNVSQADLAYYMYELKSSVNYNFTNGAKRAFGYGQDNTVFRCLMNGRDCNRSLVTWYHHLQKGNCYEYKTLIKIRRVNGKKDQKQMKIKICQKRRKKK
jgi:hypothetical protein